jgi:hypothetical protein
LTDCEFTWRKNRPLGDNLRAFRRAGEPCTALSCNNISTKRRISLPLAGETVPGFSHRLAAGVGVFAAFFLLGASATVAVAEPGGSHSDRGSSSDRGNVGGKGRGGSERHDYDRRGNYPSGVRGVGGEGNNGKRDDGASRKPDAGDDGTGAVDPGVIESPVARVGSGRVAAADTEESGPSLAAASDASDSSASRVSEPVTSAIAEAVSPGGSGSGLAGAPSPQFDPPRVTVGNGREPRIWSGPPAPQWQAPAPQPAPAVQPPPPPPPPLPAPPASPQSRVNEKSPPRVLTQQLGGVGGATDWSNPLWGLAGLLLIPAAGAALGYRQARAAHAAERLRLRRA